MNEMIRGFEFIWSYIDNLLITTKGDWSDKLDRLQLTLNKFKYNGIKRHTEN